MLAPVAGGAIGYVNRWPMFGRRDVCSNANCLSATLI
jgi:hypothetical protein